MERTLVSNQGMPSRTRLLTNSAAEFLETRADTALGPELAVTGPEFVPELDGFMRREDIPKPDYYKESAERIAQFKTTLAAFQKNLTDRKIGQKFEIEIKDASEYTLDDVLKIAQTVQQKHKDADKVHSCMGRIRKFFRATGRDTSTFKKLLAFAPQDIYGSLICGGFTVILGTLERLETLRGDMYAALASIPKTMRKIHDLLDVHYQSGRLKYCADAVLVSVFVMLEQIIRELSGSVSKKVLKSPFKGEKYGSSIDDAIEVLEDAVKEFEAEAKICDSQRLGRVDSITKKTLMNTGLLDATTKRTELGVRQLSEGFASFQEEFATQLRIDHATSDEKQTKLLMNTEKVLDKLEKQAEITTERHGAQVHNVFYCFLTANPSFDSKTGTLDDFQARRRLIRAITPVSVIGEDELATAGPKPFSNKNHKIVRSWVKASGNAPKVAAGDLLDCFRDIDARPNLSEQDRVAFILTHEHVRAWLRSITSKLMVVELQSEEGQYSAASYASTVLIRSVQKIGRFPVLYHFCTSRATDHKNERLRGSTGMLISLISQLLVHLSRGPDVDLEFLERSSRQLKRDKCKTSTLNRSFKELVQLLPKNEWVYIVVDSIWKLQNEEDELAVQQLLNLVKKEGLSIKLFVADPFSVKITEMLEAKEERERKKAKTKGEDGHESSIIVLHVPENVDLGRHGINTSWVEEEMDELVDDCNTSQLSSNSDEEEDDSGSDMNQMKILD